MINTIILAIVEGLTEYLPISSTGHLIIAQKLLGFEKVDEFMTVILQFGAILAAVFYFRHKFGSILKDSSVALVNRKGITDDLGIWILVASIPTLIFAYLMSDFISELHNSLLLVSLTTILFGILFYIFEKIFKPRSFREMNFKNIFIMGIFQAISIIPGVSRSGITISGGIIQKIKYKESIEIAFIMGIPVMFAAAIYQSYKNFDVINEAGLINILVGIVVSFLVSIVSIKLTIGILTTKGFLPFMIYRIILGIGILTLLM